MESQKILLQFANNLSEFLLNYTLTQQQDAELPPLNQAFLAHPLHQLSSPPTLQHLSQPFNLSPFEQWVILLCTALELEPSISECCAQLQGNNLNQPTPNLALNLLPQPNLSFQQQRP